MAFINIPSFSRAINVSNADSFPIKSIRTSGIEVKNNPSKNTQTHILGKKVKTKSQKKTQLNLDAQNEVHNFKDNFQCQHTKYQVKVFLVK